MNVNRLTLEITRRCNLQCRHCLRGGAQRLNMSSQVLFQVARSISYAGDITFTGGEPSLAVPVLEEFLQMCRWHKLQFGYFYIVTNGKTRNGWNRFLEACDGLYGWAQEPESCVLTPSRDNFHREQHDLKLWKFMDDWSEVERPYIKLDERTEDIRNPISEGRAANGLGWRPKEVQKPWTVSEYDGELCVSEEVLYISANGNVVSSGDISFARIDREAKGNILTTPLREIVESFCIKEAEEVAA